MLQVYEPEYTDYEQDPFKSRGPNLERDLIRLADEDKGIEPRQQGSYRWLNLNETLLTTLERWMKRPYFCPYRPFHGKWILTCKSYLQDVSWNLPYTFDLICNINLRSLPTIFYVRQIIYFEYFEKLFCLLYFRQVMMIICCLQLDRWL